MTYCLLPWATKPFQKGVYSEKKRFSPRGAFFSSCKSGPAFIRDGRVAFPEYFPVYLKIE